MAVTPSTPTTPLELAERATKGGEEGREALATLVQLASTGGTGFIDPTDLVNGILLAREKARASGQYDLADELRDSLLNVGINVNDSPEGASWSLNA